MSFGGFDSGSGYVKNGTQNDVNEDIINMIKDEMKVTEHFVDLDFTTKT